MSLVHRIANLFRRGKLQHEIEQELSAHIALRTEDNIANGMSPQQARRDARLRFGNRGAMQEQAAAADTALYLASIGRDFRFAARQLRKAPSFAITAILVLSLGIAAGVSIFSFVDAALIKPVPYHDPSRLVCLFESNPLGPRFHLSYLDYLDWKRVNAVFSSMAAFDDRTIFLNTASGPQPVQSAIVGDQFFRTLGVTPALGRDFRDGDDLLGAPRTVLLSFAAWQTRYGGESDVLGKSVTIGGNPHTIVGVLPRDFHFAPVGLAEFWTTLHNSPTEDRGSHGILAIARLKDGIPLGAAAANIASIQSALASQYPDSDGGRGGTVVALPEIIVGNFRPILLMLFGSAVLLLLIAYVNVANLVLVRAEARKSEIAIRSALGASQSRLTRQFITEGLLLAAFASGAGLVVAGFIVRLLTGLLSTDMLNKMPYLDGLRLNGHSYLFACLLFVSAATLMASVPIFGLHRRGAESGLSSGARGFAGTLWRRVGSNLVVIELATAMVLLVGAGLLSKSLFRLLHTELGMQPDHLAMLHVSATGPGFATFAQQENLAREAQDRVSHLPGVASATVARGLPIVGGGGSSTFRIVGRPVTGATQEELVRQIGPGYFPTLHTRLFKGRLFGEADRLGNPRVAIVNQAFADRYLPGEDPLLKRIVDDDASPQMEIVGVVENLKESQLDHQTRPVIYVPFAQDPDRDFFVLARTSIAEKSLPVVMAEAIHQIDPALILSGQDTMASRIANSQATYLHRSSALLVGGFAALALLLAVVGLYGVIAYSVSRRTREIGVRMALGAQRTTVYRMILREAFSLIVAGLVLGVACSLGATSLMRSLLFGIQAWDVATLASVAGVLALAAVLASFLPAYRAASVNPVQALRAE
jgi:macrolide transport system ATP-binding/permease protein